MAKAAGDGQQVNIPALHVNSNGVTERSRSGGLLDFRSGYQECRQANPPAGVMPGSEYSENRCRSCCIAAEFVRRFRSASLPTLQYRNIGTRSQRKAMSGAVRQLRQRDPIKRASQKNVSGSLTCNRTGNRHRWVGRVYQGEWVSPR